MNNSYIKNSGFTQTFIKNGKDSSISEISWDGDYDGKSADISLISNINGKKENVNFILNNNQIANLLNVPSINKSIDERLINDFSEQTKTIPRLYSNTKNNYLSSPKIDEEFIIPLTMQKKTINPKLTHKSYKIYKKKKTHFKNATNSLLKKKSNTLKNTKYFSI